MYFAGEEHTAQIFEGPAPEEDWKVFSAGFSGRDDMIG